jgi:hypothetical protein
MALSKKRKVKCQKSAREKKRKPWGYTLIFPDMRQLALPQVGNEEDERPLSLMKHTQEKREDILNWYV